jgi:phosphopantothenoylcysteine decarboxylase/phosphopantothenate--cysteine ligase
MKKVLILSGPTHEYFDPVRFIGNASSGKMGKAIAEEALDRGADVTFISGPVPEPHLPNLERPVCRVTGAEEMLAAALDRFPAADLIIFAAAVADFQPLKKSTEKLPKAEKNLSIELQPTPDIAATLCACKRTDQKAVGFALQTHDGEVRAREKLVSKNLDGIVLNTPATLGAENGIFTWIDLKTVERWGPLTKAECAKRIFDMID